MNSIPIVSTFSGGGFLDLGFINNGFQTQSAFEIEPQFISAYNNGIKSYLSNTQKAQILLGQINHYQIEKPIDISSTKDQQEIKNKFKDSIQGLIGGPPCQDYSIGGKNLGVTGERGRLLHSYIELVLSLKPNFIFFENVSGLYNTKNHHSAFMEMVTKLRKNGYEVWFDILNSLNYGVPQDRLRLVLVGFKKSLVKKLVKEGYKIKSDDKYSDDLIFRWPKPKFSNPKEIHWPKIWKFGSEIKSNEIKKIPASYKQLLVVNAFESLDSDTPNQTEYFEPYSKRFTNVGEGDTNRKSFKRLHRYRYSPTVAYGNNEVHLHPTEKRRLSVREALRLQSVPDSYILPKEIPLTYKFKLISNGVPTKVASLIAKEIKRTLNLFYSI